MIDERQRRFYIKPPDFPVARSLVEEAQEGSANLNGWEVLEREITSGRDLVSLRRELRRQIVFGQAAARGGRSFEFLTINQELQKILREHPNISDTDSLTVWKSTNGETRSIGNTPDVYTTAVAKIVERFRPPEYPHLRLFLGWDLPDKLPQVTNPKIPRFDAHLPSGAFLFRDERDALRRDHWLVVDTEDAQNGDLKGKEIDVYNLYESSKKNNRHRNLRRVRMWFTKTG